MRLIDADRALEIVRDQGIAHPNAYHLTNYATLILQEAPTIEAEPVRHGRCDVCAQGKAIMTQDCLNGYSLEVDAEQQELSIWCGDECLAVFQIDYCPNCGSKLHGGVDDAD